MANGVRMMVYGGVRRQWRVPTGRTDMDEGHIDPGCCHVELPTVMSATIVSHGAYIEGHVDGDGWKWRSRRARFDRKMAEGHGNIVHSVLSETRPERRAIKTMGKKFHPGLGVLEP